MKKTVIAAIAALMSTTTVGDWEAYPEDGHRSGAVAVGGTDHKNITYQVFFPKGRCDNPVLEIGHHLGAAHELFEGAEFEDDGEWPPKGDWPKGRYHLPQEWEMKTYIDAGSSPISDESISAPPGGTGSMREGGTHISFVPLTKQHLRYLRKAKSGWLHYGWSAETYVAAVDFRGSAAALDNAERICRSK